MYNNKKCIIKNAIQETKVQDPKKNKNYIKNIIKYQIPKLFKIYNNSKNYFENWKYRNYVKILKKIPFYYNK